MHLTSVSFSYPSTPGDVRAGLTTALQHGVAPDDTFVLSTCLRIEVATAGDRHRLDEVATMLFGDPGCLGHGVVRSGEAAIAHLFRVAAGLESPILGEREILTQFRQALADAEGRGSLSGLTAKLLEAAVSVGRQARELLPESPHDSMAAVAAQVVGGAERVAVLGSGLIARSVVMSLLGLPAPPEVTVVARTPEKLNIPGVTVRSMSATSEVIETFPAVVSATSAKMRLIPEAELVEALARRSDPLLLVDMAMPPDLLPPQGVPIRYVDIDELAGRAARRPRSDDADAVVGAAAAEAYRRFADHHTVGPVIGELMRKADETVDRVVDRFAGRLGLGSDERILRQAAHSVARALLASPVSYLRSGDRPAEAVDLIATAFDIDEKR